MKLHYLSAAFLSLGLFAAMPAHAQNSPAQKQPTQEGGPSSPGPCGLPFNADPTADPDCKQRTQNLMPSSVPSNFQTAGQKK